MFAVTGLPDSAFTACPEISERGHGPAPHVGLVQHVQRRPPAIDLPAEVQVGRDDLAGVRAEAGAVQGLHVPVLLDQAACLEQRYGPFTRPPRRRHIPGSRAAGDPVAEVFSSAERIRPAAPGAVIRSAWRGAGGTIAS